MKIVLRSLLNLILYVNANYTTPFMTKTCYKSTSWQAEPAFFGREAADRAVWNPTKDFFESLFMTQ